MNVHFGRFTEKDNAYVFDLPPRASKTRSHVAAIVDHEGGMRVVVGRRRDIRDNTLEGERAYTVPHFKIYEPCPWEKIPFVIEKAFTYALSQRLSNNPCGGCHVCCHLPWIKPLAKPSRTMCRYCRKGLGCTQYRTRPEECKQFKCNWLRSQSSPEPMAANLRPDRCGMMITDDTTDGRNDVFEVHFEKLIGNDTGEITEAARDYIEDEKAKGRTAKVVTCYYGERDGGLS